VAGGWRLKAGDNWYRRISLTPCAGLQCENDFDIMYHDAGVKNENFDKKNG
jgi:hypothetical protein